MWNMNYHQNTIAYSQALFYQYIFISFFMGVSVGAGVVVARHFGAKRFENMQQAIYSSYVFTIIGGLIMTFVGVWLSPALL